MPVNFRNIKTTEDRPYDAEMVSRLNDSLQSVPARQRSYILGTIIEESAADPLAVSKSGKYQGFLQWGPDRYKIKSKDKETEFINQLQKLRNINDTTDRTNWTNGGKQSGYQSFREAYSDYNNPNFPYDQGYRAFSYGYVRPKGKEESVKNRLKVVRQVYDRLHSPDPNSYNNIDIFHYQWQEPEPFKPEKTYAEGGEIERPKKWEELSLRDKSDIMASAVRNGITTLSEIRQKWNAFAEEGFDLTLVEEDADTTKDSATKEAHLFGEGGYTDESYVPSVENYVPSAAIKTDIATWEGDSMKTNRSFEAEARSFNQAIPKHIRQGLTQAQLDALYSYGYNVGMGNLKKRVGNILHQYVQGKATAEDVANNMWAAGDKKYRGLQRRRNWEKEMFINNPLEVNTPAPNPQPSVGAPLSVGAPQPVPLFNPLFTNAVSPKPIQETRVEQPTPLLAEDQEKEADGWMLYRLLTPSEEKRKTSEENQKTSVPFIVNAPSRSTVGNGLFGGGGHLYEDGSALNTYTPYFNPVIHTLPEAVVTAPRTDDFSWLSRPLTLSNDATMVENGLPYNAHLNARSLRGSSAHAQWDKEHPMLSFIGNAVAAAPLAVAATPFALGASDAFAGTAIGKGITAGLTKASPYIDAAMTSWGGAEAGKDIINGKPNAETALDLAFSAMPFVKRASTTQKLLRPNRTRKKVSLENNVSQQREPIFHSELDWSPESWFSTRVNGLYDAEDVAALKSHIPEYLIIEQKAKANGTWLKMPDGSTWTDDPRSWVQLQSKEGQQLIQKPFFHGDTYRYTDIDGNDVTSERLGKGVLWSSSNKFLPLTYGNNHYILSIPNNTKMLSVDAQGRNWSDLKGLGLGYDNTNDISYSLLDNNNAVEIKNVLDIGSDPRWKPGKDGLPAPLPNEEFMQYSDRVFKGNDYIFGEETPRKSLIGNNGNFNLLNPNIYKGLIYPLGIGWPLNNFITDKR